MRKSLFFLFLILSLSSCSTDPEPTEEVTDTSQVILKELAANPAWRLYFYDPNEPRASYILNTIDNPFYKLFTEKIFKDCGEAAEIYMLDGQEGNYYFACNGQEFVVGLDVSFSEYEEPEWAKDRFTYASSIESLGEIKIAEDPSTYTGKPGTSFSSQVFIQEEGYLLNIYESAPTKDRYFTEEVLAQWESLKTDLAGTEINFSTIQDEALYLHATRSSNNYHVYHVESNHFPDKWGYYFLKAFDEMGNELTIKHGQNEYTNKGFDRSVVIDSVDYSDKVRFELWFHALEDGREEKLLDQSES